MSPSTVAGVEVVHEEPHVAVVLARRVGAAPRTATIGMFVSVKRSWNSMPKRDASSSR